MTTLKEKQKARKRFVGQIYSCMKARCDITRYCGFKPVEPLMELDSLLDGLVDVEQADQEMFAWYNKHKSLQGFLETRKWLRAKDIDRKIVRDKKQAITDARKLIVEHGLTKEDVFNN